MTEIKQPKLRFSGFTDPWEQRKLGDVTRIIGGGTPDSHNPQYWNGEVNWFTPTEIDGSHYVKFSKRKITKEGLKKSSAKLLPAGSVLLTSRATIGDMAIILKPSATNQGFQSIATNANISNEFIYAMEPKIKAYALKHAAGSTFLEISSHEVKNMKIPFPSYDEQSKLGDLSVTIGNLIAANQDKINQLKQLKKLLMQKIFSQEWRFKGFTDPWEQRKLGDVVKFYSGLTYHPDDVQDKGTLVIRSSNIQSGQIVSADNVYVDTTKATSTTVKIGDIITVVRNGSRSLIGKHALVRAYSKHSYVIGAFMTGIRSNQPQFINALLDSTQFSIEIRKNLGATINQITTGNFKKMTFNFPNSSEQQEIGMLFSNIDSLIAANQKKVDQLKQLKKYLMQNMFV